MLEICPIHQVKYNTETNPKCAICILLPSTQEAEMKRLQKFKVQDEAKEERNAMKIYKYEAYNKKRRDERL